MSQVVEKVSDQVRETVLDRFKHKPPTNIHVIEAHEEARARCMDLANWAMDTLPPGGDLDAALMAILGACVMLNSAIAQTQLIGDAQRLLDRLKTEAAESPSEPADEPSPE